MKKIFMSLAIAAMVVAVASCGNNANKKTEKAVEAAGEEIGRA